METISIVVYPASAVVFDGIAGRLMWQAPGLDIYLSGKYDARRWAEIQHLAVSECVARHIQAISLRRVGGYRQAARKKIDPKQKGLFDGN